MSPRLQMSGSFASALASPTSPQVSATLLSKPVGGGDNDEHLRQPEGQRSAADSNTGMPPPTVRCSHSFSVASSEGPTIFTPPSVLSECDTTEHAADRLSESSDPIEMASNFPVAVNITTTVNVRTAGGLVETVATTSHGYVLYVTSLDPALISLQHHDSKPNATSRLFRPLRAGCRSAGAKCQFAGRDPDSESVLSISSQGDVVRGVGSIF